METIAAEPDEILLDTKPKKKKGKKGKGKKKKALKEASSQQEMSDVADSNF